MASTEKAAPCLMCLGFPAVHTVKNCQHSFCEACLSSYRNDNDGIACPACKGQCGQVETDTICEEGWTDGQLKSDTKGADTEYGKGDSGESFCKICFYRGKTVRATKVCVDCKNIPMCPSCIQEHKLHEVAQNHMTVPIIHIKQNCDNHGERLELFCQTCSRYICYICLTLEHADHKMETLKGIIQTGVVEVKAALELEQGRLTRLQGDKTYLQESRSTAQDMEDTLIKAIEDHTEKIIEEAITNKETLKKEVRSTFEVIGTLAKWLEDIPELLKVSEGILAKGKNVLHEAEQTSAYVDKLRGVKQELEELTGGGADYAKKTEKYRSAYMKLCGVDMKFYPRSPNMNIGGFKDLKLGPRCDAEGSCVCETCQQSFKFPHRNRVVECHNNRTCMCDTCGSVFHRGKLSFDGRCKSCAVKGCSSLIATPYPIYLHPRRANLGDVSPSKS